MEVKGTQTIMIIREDGFQIFEAAADIQLVDFREGRGEIFL